MAKTATLFDDFNDNSSDLTKWDPFNSPAETNHELEIVLSAGATLFKGYDSANLLDLTGSFAFTQVVDAGNQALVSLQVFPVGILLDANNTLQWFISQNNISALKKIGGTNTFLSTVAFDATAHKWLRIRESGGTIFWDYSADGLTWTNFTSTANPFAITSVTVEMVAGTYAAEASSTTVKLDNFNTAIQTASAVTAAGSSDMSLAAQHIITSGAFNFDSSSDVNFYSPIVFDSTSDLALSPVHIPINAYGSTYTDYRVLINGVDRTGDIIAGSLTIDDLLYDQANVATFNMELLSNLAAPQNDQEVYVWLDNELQFGGLIDAVKSQRVAGQHDIWEIDCVDFTHLLDKRLVNQTFTNMLDVDIVMAIVDSYAPDEGITMDSITTDGIMVSQLSWNYVSPSQALSDLAKLTGRFWYIDYAKDLHYFPLLQNQTPFAITDDSNTFTNLGTAKDTSQLRNRIFVQGGTELSDPFTESQKADGIQTIFLLAEKPHSITMTLNGVAKTIGIENIDDPTTVNFLVNYEEKYIKVGNVATPANGDSLVFTYQYDVPVLVSIEDTASIAADGAYEYPIIDSTIVTTQAARDRATAELTDYAQTLVSVSYNTMVRNLRSGMYQNIILTPQGINGDYVISEVKMQSVSGGLFVSTVTLTSAKVIGIIKFLIDMLNVNHTLGVFDPNAKVDGFAGLTDSLNPLTDSLIDSLGGSAAKWSNDTGTTTNKLKWNLGQWQ